MKAQKASFMKRVYKMPSRKQRIQRERFMYKGFLSGLHTRCNQLLPSQYLTRIEKDRLELIRDCVKMSLDYFENSSALIREQAV